MLEAKSASFPDRSRTRSAARTSASASASASAATNAAASDTAAVTVAAVAVDAVERFLHGFGVLLAYQLAGEALVLLLGLPVSGSVTGMALLFLTLVARARPIESVDRCATSLLSHLPVLFVPAGVGVVEHAARIGDEWLAIGATLVLGTVATLACTAWTMKWALRIGARSKTKR